jgi:hypothetical protein
MNVLTAVRNIHADRLWWRKTLIGGALMMSILGYPFAAGLVVENMDNARKGYPTPIPPWGDWSSRYLIGLFSWLIDFLFFALPLLVAALIFFCVGIGSVIGRSEGTAGVITPLIIGAVTLFQALMFLTGVSPVGRLIFVQEGSPENAMSAETLREALRGGAWSVYARARIASLPAYLPLALLVLCLWGALQAPFSIALPLAVALVWLVFSALFYAHLAVAQVYAEADRLLESRGLGRLDSQLG